jgi:hypothetical protein
MWVVLDDLLDRGQGLRAFLLARFGMGIILLSCFPGKGTIYSGFHVYEGQQKPCLVRLLVSFLSPTRVETAVSLNFERQYVRARLRKTINSAMPREVNRLMDVIAIYRFIAIELRI